MIGRTEGYINPSDIIPINIKNNKTKTIQENQANNKNQVNQANNKNQVNQVNQYNKNTPNLNELPFITQKQIEYLMRDKEIKYIKPEVILDENKPKRVRKTKTETETKTKIDKIKIDKKKIDKKNIESVKKSKKESNTTDSVSNNFIKNDNHKNSLLKLKIEPNFNEEQLNNLIIPSHYLINKTKSSNKTLKSSNKTLILSKQK